MTDKQIIIDGVDVSGCKHYKNRTCIADYCLTDMPFGEAKCELNPNCYYKQLKAKEQECERLKIYIESNEQQVKEVETLVMDNDRLINELDQLKAENDELKGIRDRNFLHALEEQKRADKLSKTLTEIKEIAEHCIQQDICTTCDNSDRCHIEDEEIPTYDVCKLILQKISECEGNDEN